MSDYDTQTILIRGNDGAYEPIRRSLVAWALNPQWRDIMRQDIRRTIIDLMLAGF